MNGVDEKMGSDGERMEGRIVEWNDRKGFGWISAGEKRVFFHIKDLRANQLRPRKRARVVFLKDTDEKGRLRAVRVAIVSGGKVGGRSGIVVGACLLLVVLLGIPALVVTKLHFRYSVPWWLGTGWMVVASVVTYGAYRSDKDRAQRGLQRTPETTLHLMELLGGWPGGWLAQRTLRHKCRKVGYQVVFWLIVMLFQVAGWDFVKGFPMARRVMVFLMSGS